MLIDSNPVTRALGNTLTEALRDIRVGDYKSADATLNSVMDHMATERVDLLREPSPYEYYQLRLATLVAEVAEYKGDYDLERRALMPYDRIVKELEEMQDTNGSLDFTGLSRAQHLLVRQKLYYLWQKSVWLYRHGAINRSRVLLDVALDLATRLRPRSEALLTQLYYGAGKLAFHECKENDAIAMYRESLMSTSKRLDIARLTKKTKKAFMRDEIKAAQYSLAKTLALGLGQCLREQARLEEAHTQVVAGQLLLNLGADKQLSHYASLLLGSIERSMAGEGRTELLEHASEQITACAGYFKSHHGEVGRRSRLELALVRMQEKKLDEAKRMLEAMLNTDPAPPAKWIAESNIGLSRIARRVKEHDEAVTFAREAVRAASALGLERIKRRAQVVFVLALYEAATDGGIRQHILKETLTELDRALSPTEPDIRTRANMLLTKARVLNARGDKALARRVFSEYETLSPLVQVGRINELAMTVANELEVMKDFRCPADSDPPDYNVDKNIEALRNYIKTKSEEDPRFRTATERAKALNRDRKTLYSKPKPRSQRIRR
jgi:tetratricopeptide (TPR) repeat protein